MKDKNIEEICKILGIDKDQLSEKELDYLKEELAKNILILDRFYKYTHNHDLDQELVFESLKKLSDFLEE